MKADKYSCKELPKECWELILNRLALDHDYRDSQSPSSVCRQFLSITDRLRHRLVARNGVFFGNGGEVSFRALERFGNLKKVELYSPINRVVGNNNNVDTIDLITRKIASSRLDLQSIVFHNWQKPPSVKRVLGLWDPTMKNLKVLTCRGFKSLGDSDLIAIADAFPWLEQLDIYAPMVRYPDNSKPNVTDAGIEVISRKLKGLRKIDIGRNCGCSNRSLIALSSNCVLLNEIRCDRCSLTKTGIRFVIHHSPNLIFLQVFYWRSPQDLSLALDNSKIHARALRTLELCGAENQGRLLCSVAESGMPLLERLKLCNNYGLSFHGLSTFIRACPSLKHLELWHIKFLTDELMRDLCRYLPKLVTVKLPGCSNLTIATFSILPKACPALSEITLRFSYPEVQDGFVMDLMINDQLSCLDCSFCSRLDDELLKKCRDHVPQLTYTQCTQM